MSYEIYKSSFKCPDKIKIQYVTLKKCKKSLMTLSESIVLSPENVFLVGLETSKERVS
jgi:hypothetical protein